MYPEIPYLEKYREQDTVRFTRRFRVREEEYCKTLSVANEREKEERGGQEKEGKREQRITVAGRGADSGAVDLNEGEKNNHGVLQLFSFLQ